MPGIRRTATARTGGSASTRSATRCCCQTALPRLDSSARSDRLVFDRLATQPDAARLVYAPGSGIPFYGGRRTRFLYVVTNTFRDGVATEDFWDTTPLAPGRYTVRVHARDIHGNEVNANRDFPVVVARFEPGLLSVT